MRHSDIYANPNANVKPNTDAHSYIYTKTYAHSKEHTTG
jgi:hypothetical protein